MSAELGLAIFAAVDLCFKYGNLLIELCNSFRNAQIELAERVLRVESIWLRTNAQLKFLNSVWDTLEESHQKIQSQIVEVLSIKLKVAVSKVERVIQQDDSDQRSDKVKRWRYALFKEGLDKSLMDLEEWQKIFDPSWFLIMRSANAQIDLQLSQSDKTAQQNPIESADSLRKALRPPMDDKSKIFLPADGLDQAQITEIPMASIKLAQRHGSSKLHILETTIRPNYAVPSSFTKAIRDIARKLSHADPLTFRLFNCSGVVRYIEPGESQPYSFTFVFRMPQGFANPRSLRHILHNDDKAHSLSERFQIANDLARAVSYVHSFEFVHKNIRPETIILLSDQTSRLGTPFLAGFEIFRPADGSTMKIGDSNWNLNIYRHPGRQGENPKDDYVMQHDIYSLGVCLLELGLFQSFIIYDEEGIPDTTSPTFGLSIDDLLSIEPIAIKEHLVRMAETQLPECMGDRYTSVVVTCLTCLDTDNIDFGDESEFQDEDGILVSVRYVEKVLVQLSDIAI